VSELSFQPFITKHFDKGWYVGTADDPHKYDFKTDKFSWNLGPQVGRVFKLGKLPVKLFGQVAYNPQNDAGSIPEWTFKINLTLLFPE
jgi:hypothetical protein